MSVPSAIEILYKDASLLVVNKPAGLSTLPDGYDPSLPHVKSLLEHDYARLWTVHRLDKHTSGVLLFACSAEAHRALNLQFERHAIFKVYHALVFGSPPWREKTIDLPLRPNGDRQHRTVIDQQAGKPAITHLRVLERFAACCLLEAIPETGRTHQIRLHLSAIGLPVIGDKLYGRKADQDGEAVLTPPLSDGMGLHARSLQVDHPVSGERMKFTAPYPLAWEDLLMRLRGMHIPR
jgi:RluA family pseudouridine synthase